MKRILCVHDIAWNKLTPDRSNTWQMKGGRMNVGHSVYNDYLSPLQFRSISASSSLHALLAETTAFCHALLRLPTLRQS